MRPKQQTESVDLIRERKLATFDVEELACWWAGGIDELYEKRKFEKVFLQDPELVDDVHTSYLSHKELYEHCLMKATTFSTKLRQLMEFTDGGEIDHQKLMHSFWKMLGGPLGTALLPHGNPLRLHFSMFIPALLHLATDEQQKLWLDKAWKCNFIGTYAQTELGHGTYVKGLESRADYDERKEEFVLNTPEITSYKWWPGGLGQTSNVAIVMAQLYIKGRHFGLQPFLVRIRNADSHKPEPGVEVGEIGPKFGLNGMNNGFLGLKNVRIPRTQMLMRNAQVLSDGTFVPGKQPLLIYAAMLYSRVKITLNVSFSILEAATIATRYSAVRRQSLIEPNQTDAQIIDHVTQQAKIFPQIARGIVYKLASDYLWEMYESTMKDVRSSESESNRLSELHALSCCLKAVCSSEGAASLEILRLSCGGQGFLESSGLPALYKTTTAACTYEGENTILLLQTARFLLKNFVEGMKRRVIPPTVTYLRNIQRVQWTRSLKTLVRAIEYTALQKVRHTFDFIQAQVKKGDSIEVATSLAGVRLTRAAVLHGHAFLARLAFENVRFRSKEISPNLAEVLCQLQELFLLETFLSNLADILRYNEFTHPNILFLEARYEMVLASLRPNAVALVDGFDFNDRVLASTLGAYDGRVYERLLDEARRSPLNVEKLNKTVHSHLSSLMSAQL